ncbi:MAG: hypothetical protein ABI782_10330 [Anaerolineaceae bacterium]
MPGGTMPRLTISEAFARYGATLKHVNWSVSAEAPDGSLVVSLWQHHFTKDPDGMLVCRDSFARWGGPGNIEFRDRVTAALGGKQRVRLVTVHALDTAAIQAGVDASTIKKDFGVREDLIGEVVAIDGDNCTICFTRV